MRLDEIVNDQPKQEDPKKENVDIEKLAEVLDALAEEDTLLDDLARAAAALEVMEKRYGQKGNAQAGS